MIVAKIIYGEMILHFPEISPVVFSKIVAVVLYWPVVANEYLETELHAWQEYMVEYFWGSIACHELHFLFPYVKKSFAEVLLGGGSGLNFQVFKFYRKKTGKIYIV